MNKYYVLLLCFSGIFNVMAEEVSANELISHKERVKQAILKFEDTRTEHWSYKVSRFENEEGEITSSIEQYFPQENERWLLKQINGQQPSKKQIQSFAKKKQKESNKGEEGGNIDLKLRELINQESLSFVSSDDKTIVMAFNVHLKKLGKDAAGKLQGKLIYQKENQFIEEILIWNNDEFSPMLTAKITDLAITFTFIHINGSILTKKNEMKMKGSFAYFTEINETSVDDFSDYLYLGDQVE